MLTAALDKIKETANHINSWTGKMDSLQKVLSIAKTLDGIRQERSTCCIPHCEARSLLDMRCTAGRSFVGRLR